MEVQNASVFNCFCLFSSIAETIKAKRRLVSENCSLHLQEKMSESCGSNAEGEVCTRKRAHKELSDSAESSEKPMASTPEQPRPSKSRRVDSEEYPEEFTKIILQAAVEVVSEWPRNEHNQQITLLDSNEIVRKISEKFPMMCISHLEVNRIMEEFFWEFETFCSQMTDHPDVIAKHKVKFCPWDGTIYPTTKQYLKTKTALDKQYQRPLLYYDLLRNIFTFTWETFFGPESQFAHNQQNNSSSSGCSSCLEMNEALLSCI